jgi:OPT oligopeptide transporter protein
VVWVRVRDLLLLGGRCRRGKSRYGALRAGQVPNYYDIGLGHGYARLGINTLRDGTGHLCAAVRLYLCDDRSSGGFTRFHMTPLYRCTDVLPCLQISVNLIAQIIPGTLLPGQPLANMIFKAYSVQTLTEATSFVQDLKLGHYIKVAPRATFIGAPFRVCQDPLC